MKRYLKKFVKNLKDNRKTYNEKSKDIFKSLPNGLTLLDIGAAGGIQPRWEKVCEYLNFIGVEPDSRSNTELSNNKFRDAKILNTFAWSEETEIEFNLCKKPMNSSAYKPNCELLDQFQNAQRFDVIKKEVVNAKPLSKEIGNLKIDFIKLDIQGGELNALRGLEESLNDCLGIEIEVEFSEMYKSQPLFGDIHSFLTRNGFYFFDFINLTRWERNSKNDFGSGYGRCIFGVGLWMKELENLNSSNTETYLKYSAICSLYGKTEEALNSLQLLGGDIPTKFKNTLINQLKQQKKERRKYEIMYRLWNLYSPTTRLMLFE